MKQFRIFLCLLAISFAACGSDDTPEPTPTPVPPTGKLDRTVLVYMAGDNNLSTLGSLQRDLEELKKGSQSLNTSQSLMVYVNEKGKTPYYARILNGALTDSVALNANPSSAPAVLEEALRYMCENYTAKSYGLSLWGHAKGWLIDNDSIVYAKTRAYAYDESTSPDTYMNIPSLARAIKNGMNSEKLSFILGDCCEFGCVEVAYELRNVTDYVIGSPAEIPDEGYDYANLAGYYDTGGTFYQKIIDQYWERYFTAAVANRYYINDPGDLTGYGVPLVAVKTSELENLAAATAALLKTIPDKLSPSGTLDLSEVIFYAYSNSAKGNYDMYKTLKMNTAAADFKVWEQAFDKAVPYYRSSARWKSIFTTLSTAMLKQFNAISNDSHVLAMFFPLTYYNNKTNPNWNTAIQKLQWNGPINWQQYGW